MSLAANSTEKLVRPVMPELDSLRGIAILMVLFFHGFNIAGAMSRLTGLPRLFVTAAFGGWTGVYLFFVLSGFLITGILLDSKARPDYYRRFYVRRALRILPAFYLLLVLLWILPRTGLLEGRRVEWPFLTLSFFYLANMVEFFGVSSQYTVLWSLAVEEQFYLIWPTVVRALSPRRIAACAIGIFVACPILRALAFRFANDTGAGYSWLVADALAIGALMGVLVRGRLMQRPAMRNFSLICVAAAIALLAIGSPFGIWRGSTMFGATFRRTAVNLLCAGLLGISLLLGTSPYKWIVRRPLLQWFGEISYGLYLVHMLAFDFVNHLLAGFYPQAYAHLSSRFDVIVLRFLVAGALAVTAAYLSRRYFEEWFLRQKDRWASGESLPVRSAAIGVDAETSGRTV